MNRTYKYITLAALALGFAACSQDDDFAPQQADIVKIASANIATEVQTRVNTLAGGAQWENNDQILVVNNSRANKNSGTYTATVSGETTTWTLSSDIVLYASGSNDFTAYYPAVAEADYTLPADQSTEASIKSADRMVATATNVAKGEAVALSFNRQYAMVTINPDFNTEFDGDATINSMQIAGITPYLSTGSTSYKAIIAPATTGFTVTLTVGDQTLTANTTTAIEAGKHYTFNLTVGKHAISFGNVTVAEWTQESIANGEAEETTRYTIDATAMSAEDLENVVLELLKGQQTDTNIEVKLAEKPTIEIFYAIRSALMNGSAYVQVNLTLSGCTEIPPAPETDNNAIGALSQLDPWLNSVTLPDVVTIGSYAFFNCQKLTSVSAPNATIIGSYAFHYNRMLTKIDMPLAEEIQSDAFSNTERLPHVSFPYVITIGDNAFDGSAITSASFPKVKTIGNGGLASGLLEDLDIPEVTSIGNSAFSNAKITNIDLPNVTIVGDNVFNGCIKLQTVNIPNATSIGNLAFSLCTSLETVSFPNATSIGDQAFYQCTSLKTVSLPKATSIGDNAFCQCTSFETVNLPFVNTLGYGVFSDCPALSDITFGNNLISALEGKNSNGVFGLLNNEFNTTQVSNITLTLSKGQKVLNKKEKTDESGYTYYEWEPASPEELYKESSEYTNNSFLNYTFKEIKLTE